MNEKQFIQFDKGKKTHRLFKQPELTGTLCGRSLKTHPHFHPVDPKVDCKVCVKRWDHLKRNQ